MTLTPNAVRSRNKLSVEKRNAWRMRYKILTDSIKAAKHRVRQNGSNRQYQLELQSLQIMAQIMMQERNLLTLDLQDSAYKWV